MTTSRRPDKYYDDGDNGDDDGDGDEDDDIEINRCDGTGCGTRGGGRNPNCRQASEPQTLVFDTHSSLLHHAQHSP